jgi:glycosyltransferase involved in cell wall biosynthesis
MPPQRMHHLIKHLSEHNEVTVLCTDVWWLERVSDPFLEETFKGVELLRTSRRRTNSIFQELAFCAGYGHFTREHPLSEYDLHLNLNSPIAGYFITRQTGITTIFDIFDDLVEWVKISPQIPPVMKPFGGLIGRMLLDKNVHTAKRVTYITELLREQYKLPLEKARYLPNGVDTTLFCKRDGENVREQLGLADTFTIGYVGGLKNWVDLKPAFEVLKSSGSGPDIKLLVVGEEGDLRKNVELAAQYGVTDNTIFTGFVPRTDVPDYIAAMDVCLVPFAVSPVTNNALPLKLLEYLACEKPVVSTPLHGVREVGAPGVMYANDAVTLKYILTQLREDEPKREALGNTGRAFVKQRYGWETIFRNLDTTIAEAVGDRGS